MASLEVLVAMAKGLLRSGRERTGCLENSSFNWSNAFWQEGLYFHSWFFLVRLMREQAMFE